METNPNYQRETGPDLILESDLSNASLEQSLVEAMKIINRCTAMMKRPLADTNRAAKELRGKERDENWLKVHCAMLDANSAAGSMRAALSHLDSALYRLYRRQVLPFFEGNRLRTASPRCAQEFKVPSKEWLPIDTYFDGKVSHKFVALCEIDFTCVGLWDSDSSHGWVDSFGEPIAPTHWYPLPDSPFSEAK